MTFVIPTAKDLLNYDWDSGSRSNGAFASGQPGTRNTKSAGGLPISGPTATAFVNTQSSNATGAIKGVYHDFDAVQAAYDVSTESKLVAFCFQFNAPNRIQVTTIANHGLVFRAYSGTGVVANHRQWDIGGNDTFLGQCQNGNAYVLIDLNDPGFDLETGTYNNTDVRGWGFGTVRFNIAGSSTTQYFFSRLFLLDTTKNAVNIPRFTGLLSNWDDVISAQDGVDFSTKITNLYQQLGRTFSITTPFEFGDNSTSTQFNDGGDTVVSPSDNVSGDHRSRLTTQAMRVYLNLRNNAADAVVLSGSYFWGTAAPWDFNQSNSAVVTIDGASFSGMGNFTLGSSCSGAATFSLASGSDVIVNGANLNGSTINGDLVLNTEEDLTNITVNGDLRISTGLDSSLTFSNVSVTGNVFNDSGSNTLSISSTNGSSLTTSESGTGNGQVEISNNVTISVTVLDDSTGLPIPTTARVQLYDSANHSTVILNSACDGFGVATSVINYSSDINVTGWAREWNLSGTDYVPKDISGTITSSGLTLTVRLTPIN